MCRGDCRPSGCEKPTHRQRDDVRSRSKRSLLVSSNRRQRGKRGRSVASDRLGQPSSVLDNLFCECSLRIKRSKARRLACKLWVRCDDREARQLEHMIERGQDG